MLKKELAEVELPTEAEAGELQKLRDKYFDDIFTERLYGYLGPESQIALSRSAVYGVPVTMEGLRAVAGETLEGVEAFANEWKDRAFAYQETGKALWSVYGLLRGWLLAKLSPEERKSAHRAAGDFMAKIRQQKRTGELGLYWVDCSIEAQAQYLNAEEFERAREENDKISGSFLIQGLYHGVRLLNEELLVYEEHPLPMNRIAWAYSKQGDFNEAREWYQKSLDASGNRPKEAWMAWNGLGTSDLLQGYYQDAEDKFQKSLVITQQIGDKKGEACVLHNLATIELNQGQYDAAREKFEKAMEIKQQIEDWFGIDETLHQLATIDLNQGQYDAAREKFESSIKISQRIGNRAGEAGNWHQLAIIDTEQRQYQAAKEKFEKAMEIRVQIGDRAGEAYTWHALASIELGSRTVQCGQREV